MNSVEIGNDYVFEWDNVFERDLNKQIDKCGINASNNICKLGKGFFGYTYKYDTDCSNSPTVIVKITKNKFPGKSSLTIKDAIISRLKKKINVDYEEEEEKKNNSDSEEVKKKQEESLKQEASIVLNLNNKTVKDARKKHILKGYGITTDNNNRIYFFSKYYENKSIDDYWINGGIGTNDNKRKQLFKLPFDVLKGLNFLHEKEYIHLDIACRNIFYDNNVYVIGDFGLCKKHGKPIEEGSNVPPFFSITNGPNNLNVSYYNDYISLGCMLLELLLFINKKLLPKNNNINDYSNYNMAELWSYFKILNEFKEFGFLDAKKETYISKYVDDADDSVQNKFINIMLGLETDPNIGSIPHPTFSNSTHVWSDSVLQLFSHINNNKHAANTVFGESGMESNDNFYKVVDFYKIIIEKIFEFKGYDEIMKQNGEKLTQKFKVNQVQPPWDPVEKWNWE
tara:strand:+ start:731 stop:2089 length:1359 start_codon:yes stop_codon:yes gene_type:complete